MAEIKSKSPVQLLIILIVAVLFLAVGLFYSLKKEQAKSLALQEQLEDIKARQRITEAKLEESQKTVTLLESELERTKAQINTLTDDLNKEKSAKEELLSQFGQLKGDLEQQKTLRADLEAKLSQAQEEMKKIREQLKDLSSYKTTLENKIKKMETGQAAGAEGVELGKIVVSPETETLGGVKKATLKKIEKKASAKKSEGKVLVVNKEYNFAVINLGSNDGVKIGDEFSVYRDNRYLGDLQVEKVHDSMAAAGFATPDLKDKISEGDVLTQKVKW